MISRYLGSALGLFAFTVAVVAGFFAGNDPQTVLSRAIFALFSFCMLGFVLGAVAQLVVVEHEKSERSRIEEDYAIPEGLETEPEADDEEVFEAAPAVGPVGAT